MSEVMKDIMIIILLLNTLAATYFAIFHIKRVLEGVGKRMDIVMIIVNILAIILSIGIINRNIESRVEKEVVKTEIKRV